MLMHEKTCVIPIFFNSLPATHDFCSLLITLANSLNADQDRQNLGPALDPNHDTMMVLMKDFSFQVYFKKKSADDNISMKNYPACKELKHVHKKCLAPF